jgi:hypothetical protein
VLVPREGWELVSTEKKELEDVVEAAVIIEADGWMAAQ